MLVVAVVSDDDEDDDVDVEYPWRYKEVDIQEIHISEIRCINIGNVVGTTGTGAKNPPLLKKSGAVIASTNPNNCAVNINTNISPKNNLVSSIFIIIIIIVIVIIIIIILYHRKTKGIIGSSFILLFYVKVNIVSTNSNRARFYSMVITIIIQWYSLYDKWFYDQHCKM